MRNRTRFQVLCRLANGARWNCYVSAYGPAQARLKAHNRATAAGVGTRVLAVRRFEHGPFSRLLNRARFV